MVKSKLYVLIGPAGTGKSTFAKKLRHDLYHHKQQKTVVVSTDSIRKELCGNINDQSKNHAVWQTAYFRMLLHLMQGDTVIFDAMNLKTTERKKLLDYAKSIPNLFVVSTAIVFEGNPEESKIRIFEDILCQRDRANVPEEIVDKMFQTFNSCKSTIPEQFKTVINAEDYKFYCTSKWCWKNMFGLL